MVTLNNGILEVEILEKGVTIKSFKNLNDNINITTAYKNIEDYQDNPLYLGALIGPLAGRTAQNRYGETLEINNAPNQLHGGTDGLHSQIFTVKDKTETEATFELKHKDVHYVIKLSLDNNNLILDMHATPKTDKRLNLTNHMYFNLLGEDNLNQHSVILSADKVSLHNENMQNDGNLIDVKDTVFDLNEKKNVKDLLMQKHPQFEMTRHIDHSFLANEVTLFAGKKSLKVKATTPYMHLYFANYFDEQAIGEKGYPLQNYSAIAIEAQYVPNDIDMPVYNKDKPYHETIVYTLS